MKVVAVFFLLIPIVGMASQNNGSQSGQQTEVEEGPMLWVGPGLYYGIWFNNEEDYDEWKRNGNYHGPNRRADRREDRRGGDRGGGRR